MGGGMGELGVCNFLGALLDIDNRFYAFDEPIPTSLESWDLSIGRIPMITWGAGADTIQLRTGVHDAWLRAQAAAWRPSVSRSPCATTTSRTLATVPPRCTRPRSSSRRGATCTRSSPQRGATNVVWVWCPTAWTFVTRSPRPSAYYPGAAYVDWIAADGYNWYPGPGTSGAGSRRSSTSSTTGPRPRPSRSCSRRSVSGRPGAGRSQGGMDHQLARSAAVGLSDDRGDLVLRHPDDQMGSPTHGRSIPPRTPTTPTEPWARTRTFNPRHRGGGTARAGKRDRRDTPVTRDASRDLRNEGIRVNTSTKQPVLSPAGADPLPARLRSAQEDGHHPPGEQRWHQAGRLPGVGACGGEADGLPRDGHGAEAMASGQRPASRSMRSGLRPSPLVGLVHV